MAFITYKQYDSRWGRKNYNGSSTMATAGCGPTSVAMLAYAVDGKTTPLDTMKYMQTHGYAIRNNGTAWAGIPACMKAFGLLKVRNVSEMTDVFNLLASGYCAVFLFRAGSRGGVCWTTAGHYVAVTAIKKKDGKHYLYTRDSGGRNHTGWYCYETQMKGLIPQIWVGKVPEKKAAHAVVNGTPARGYYQLGDIGEPVKEVQKQLNKANTGARGYKIPVDGHFGKKTERAVKFLQNVRHLKTDGHYGPKTEAEAKKKVTGAMKAVNWAVSISWDNSFAYGVGKRAHNYGCYFCGTNRSGKKHAKKGSRWDKTYCCNPFITAAYAHGTKDPAVLKACKAGGGGGMTPDSWKRYGCFKTVGKCSKVPFSKLQVGDVIIAAHNPNHVWMYTGKGCLVEANGEGWGPETIKHKHGAQKKYNSKYKKNSTAYVMRYTKG